MTAAPEPVEYVYGIESEHWEGNDDIWVPTRPVALRVTKKTARRIYYVRPGSGPERIGFVDRQKLETDGFVNRAGGWWEIDLRVHREPPVLAEQEPDLAELKAAMAAAHPDRGGTDAEFITARANFERARTAMRSQT
ncbi:hypothetical protein [Streptomyces candidus]|uniref:Uncharacterized protein n=1 Tax=Streptomyces candidus TaxID=67283 RepID=A0A7X0HMI0_9ACTN|nr:hypothetical protein [Streptomyces candidus]MBB6440255.1 hypothetical protein [Streptomyces candidus]GHH58149.1 hypothetical protein GCM10018773_66230 [Streptomyces candidus]